MKFFIETLISFVKKLHMNSGHLLDSVKEALVVAEYLSFNLAGSVKKSRNSVYRRLLIYFRLKQLLSASKKTRITAQSFFF